MDHAWDVSVPEATAIQKRLRSEIRLERLPQEPRTIGGADISFGRFSDRFFACVAVFSYPDLALVETSYSEMTVRFPYVPGYLSFREVPAIAAAYRALKTPPDVLMMDGHGIAHPRRVGVAAHLGLALERPVFGCAKSILFGSGMDPDTRAGSTSPLFDLTAGETIGACVRTKDAVKPVIVSPGHLVTLAESVELTLKSVRRHRIPEPTRLAHELVNEYRRERAGK